jgi:hypothetical protein
LVNLSANFAAAKPAPAVNSHREAASLIAAAAADEASVAVLPVPPGCCTAAAAVVVLFCCWRTLCCEALPAAALVLRGRLPACLGAACVTHQPT